MKESELKMDPHNRPIQKSELKTKKLDRSMKESELKMDRHNRPIQKSELKTKKLDRSMKESELKMDRRNRPIQKSELYINRFCRPIQSEDRIGIGRSINRTFRPPLADCQPCIVRLWQGAGRLAHHRINKKKIEEQQANVIIICGVLSALCSEALKGSWQAGPP